MIKNYYDDIVNCVNVLKQQGIIIYPTDTIWGIGCDATQSKPVRRVFNVKKRDEAKALIVLLDDVAKLSYYVNNVPPIAYDLMKQVNTPLTIIYQGARNLAPQCASADGSVAIRIVRDDFCKDLISSFGKPINVNGAGGGAVSHSASIAANLVFCTCPTV